MRQIKFRFWSPVKNELENTALIEVGSNGEFIHLYVEEFIPLQFTGLLDKNGKEIYEGDVVQEGISRCEVLWGVSGWDPFEYCGGGELNSNQCEIIGNIYENPNLLEK